MMYSICTRYALVNMLRVTSLQARRDELEGLDLAVERQKRSLRGMRDTERELLAQREAARQELQQLKQGGGGRHRRQRRR